MRQDFTRQKLASCARPRAAKGVSTIFVICVVLASGAAFGMVAQAALHHVALDFGSIRDDLFVERTASARGAAAWWAWWVVAVAAVFVGPLSAGLARTLIANRRPPRGPRLAVTAAVVLALAAICGMPPLTFTIHAALGLVVVVAGTTLLAALGAYFLSGLAAKPATVRVQMPASGRLAVAQPSRGGGSIRSGLPFLLFRQRNALAPGSFSRASLGLAAGPAIFVFTAVSMLGGAAVLVNSLAPSAARELVAARIPPAGPTGHARAVVLALLPVEEHRRVVMPPVALLDAPPLKPIEPIDPIEPPVPPEPRQRAITASVSGPVPESDLTFAKGYSRRRAAQLVANMTSPPSIPALTAAINIKKIRTASLRFTPQERRVSRPAADNRSWADTRFWADNRSWADSRNFADTPPRTTRQAHGQDRYADRQARYADYDHGGRDRSDRRDRRRAYDRFGDGSFARVEAPYRGF
jgi:hypothetical protein